MVVSFVNLSMNIVDSRVFNTKKCPQNSLAPWLGRNDEQDIDEEVRCLLSKAKLLGSFWGQALYIVTYVINLSPIIALQANILDRV